MTDQTDTDDTARESGRATRYYECRDCGKYFATWRSVREHESDTGHVVPPEKRSRPRDIVAER